MHSRLIVSVLALVLALAPGTVIGAQETFEAASIKLSGDVERVVPGVFLPNGGWSARGATLAMLLRSAYALDRFVGMPAWAYSQRFDVVTTPSPGAPLAQLQAMARQLLAARFELRAHVEQQADEVYRLVRVNASGPLGPGLRASAATCPRGRLSPAAPSDPNHVQQCAESMRPVAGGAFRIQLRDRVLNDFLILSSARSEIGGPIVDRTGLTGTFDIDLEFARRDLRGLNVDGLGLPFEVAVETQLGIRFERRQELVDLLVVDHVALPTPD